MTAFGLIGVMVGGALGALARFLVGALSAALVARSALAGWPWATLGVNVLGSFLLSLLVTLVSRGLVDPRWRLWLGTGFLGAFTTFSTFSLEADDLARRGEPGVAALYVVLSVGLGLLGVLAGRLVGTRA
ncbi:fluoride efflux transporter CrcB [Deinococcus pimensis]|uniref:fluoride efflux transporter CrcB n=1 Tax=Deinococcus pimensis TaxID=309888 RepID=UPI00048038FB